MATVIGVSVGIVDEAPIGASYSRIGIPCPEGERLLPRWTVGGHPKIPPNTPHKSPLADDDGSRRLHHSRDVAKTRLAVIAVITILTGVLSATATANQAITAPTAVATSIANRFWGSVPCGGKVKLLTQQSVPSTLVQHDADAWVTFNSSLGANNLNASAASYTNCVVHLGRYRWPTAASMTQDWDMLCMTITHELGHLLGHPHNTTRGNVMNPVFVNYSSEPQLCRTDRPSGAGPPA